MSKATVLTGSSAQDVREYFRTDAAARKALSPEARQSVRKQDKGRTLRGRLHPEAIAAFNEAHPDATYTTGKGVVKQVVINGRRFQPKGIRREKVVLKASEARDALRLAGVEVGERGVFSAAQTEALESMVILDKHADSL